MINIIKFGESKQYEVITERSYHQFKIGQVVSLSELFDRDVDGDLFYFDIMGKGQWLKDSDVKLIEEIEEIK